MTDIVVTRDLVQPLAAACEAAGLPRFTEELGVPLGTNPATRILRWTPDLSPEQVTTLTALTKTATGTALLSPADYAALEPRLAAIRLLRQQSQAEFMAKTANQRDRELFDLGNDLAAIVLRLLRD
jgi:hypothetical protein